MSDKTDDTNHKRRLIRMSTRDAVETAIELSKKDKTASWESLAGDKTRMRHGRIDAEDPSPPSCKTPPSQSPPSHQ